MKMWSGLIISLVSVGVFAQEAGQVTTTSKQESGLVKGIRISLVKPSSYSTTSSYSVEKINGKAVQGGASIGNSDTFKNILGLSVGYANLPVQETGWTTNLAVLHSSEQNNVFDIYRLDGNVAYAFTSSLHAFAGMNVSSANSKDTKTQESTTAESSTPGLGFQVGGGWQINKNISLDLSYVEMNRRSELKTQVIQNGVAVNNTTLAGDVKTIGTEVTLSTTF